jgi:Flp pilus assembly protein TadG
MKRIIFRFRTFSRAAEGANLLEAAVITPLLLLMTFAIVDFAAMLYVHLALQNGVAQASRYAVTGNARPGMNREQSIKVVMREATPSLTLNDGAFSFSNLPPGGNAWVGGLGGPNAIDKVRITYTWTVLTPVLRPFFSRTNGQMNFVVESAMRNESRFQ